MDCTICCESTSNRDTCTLPCYHVICNICFNKWILKSNKCPLCRSDIKDEISLETQCIQTIISGLEQVNHAFLRYKTIRKTCKDKQILTNINDLLENIKELHFFENIICTNATSEEIDRTMNFINYIGAQINTDDEEDDDYLPPIDDHQSDEDYSYDESDDESKDENRYESDAYSFDETCNSCLEYDFNCTCRICEKCKEFHLKNVDCNEETCV
jgi:hypothetical protein